MAKAKRIDLGALQNALNEANESVDQAYASALKAEQVLENAMVEQTRAREALRLAVQQVIK